MKHSNLIAAIAAISALGFAMGLTYPLLSLQLEARSYSMAMIGLSTASQPLGTIAALVATPWVTRRFGAKAAAIGSALLTAAVLSLYPYFESFWLWCGFRFVQGLAFSVLFAISEAWVVEFAAGPLRNRILALYMSAFAASLALGPMLIATLGSGGHAPFLAGSAIVAAVALPIAAISSAGTPAASSPIPVASLFKQNPVLVVAVAVFALTEIASLALLPVYGTSAGLSEAQSAALASAFVSGPILLQYPLGWLADRMEKRHMLIASAAFSYVGFLLLPVLLQHSVIWVLLAVLGAVTASLYTVALAVLGEKYKGDDLVAGTAVFSAIYGGGSLIGSGITGIVMSAASPAALPYVLGATMVGMVIAASVGKL